MHARGPAPAGHPQAFERSIEGVKVGVVIPAYRVSRQIEKVLAGVPPWVSSIIVVEDKSPDDTAAKVRAWRDQRVTLISHETNQGVGGAMQSGLCEALRQELDVVVKMDGDDQMNPAELPRLVAPLVDGRADVTKGNRFPSLQAIKSMPILRIVGNAGLTFLVKLASGYWSNFDPANGFVALRADVLQRLDLRKLPRRYFFESGLLIELGILRAVVLDVAMPARYGDEVSNLSVSRTLLGFPPRLFWGMLRRIFWRYLIHDFSAVSVFLLLGLPMLVLGGAYGAWTWWDLSRSADAPAWASAGQVMLAGLPVALGFQLLLQAIVLDIANVPRQPLCAPLREE
jgi:glycosyltransferase involved in cell wall biosynthesis